MSAAAALQVVCDGCELAALEDAWREAETVAAIADDLLMPPAVRRAFERLRHAATAGQTVVP